MRVRKTTIGPVIAGVLWLASVLGCASQAPVPEDNFYRLQLDTAPAAASSMLPATVAVARLQSSGVNNARALIYHDVAQPLLRGLVPAGALLWHDAFLPDPHGFADFVKNEAERAGAEVLEGTAVKRVKRSREFFSVFCSQLVNKNNEKSMINKMEKYFI